MTLRICVFLPIPGDDPALAVALGANCREQTAPRGLTQADLRIALNAYSIPKPQICHAVFLWTEKSEKWAIAKLQLARLLTGTPGLRSAPRT
jgi:hypothetical protein